MASFYLLLLDKPWGGADAERELVPCKDLSPCEGSGTPSHEWHEADFCGEPASFMNYPLE